MEGSNKNIKHEMPPSTCPKVSIANGNLLALPSSLHGGSHIGAGADSSGTKTCSVQGSVNQTNRNLILDTSGGGNSTKVVRWGRKLDHNMDPKVLKKVISNRVSAQKSRNKQAKYISDMEKKVISLQTLIAVLSPQVAQYRTKKYLLQMEQANLNKRISDCFNKELVVEAEIFARIEEFKRLQQQLMQQQQQQNLQGQATIMDVGEHDQSIEEMMNACLNSETEYTTTDVWEHELVKELMNPCLNSRTELTPDVWGHELSKELMNPCLNSGTELTPDVWEHELSKELMNPCLSSGTEQTMCESPNEVDSEGENEHNEDQLHLKQENEH